MTATSKTKPQFIVLTESDNTRKYASRHYTTETGPPIAYFWGNAGNGIILTARVDENGHRHVEVRRQIPNTNTNVLVEIDLDA